MSVWYAIYGTLKKTLTESTEHYNTVNFFQILTKKPHMGYILCVQTLIQSLPQALQGHMQHPVILDQGKAAPD